MSNHIPNASEGGPIHIRSDPSDKLVTKFMEHAYSLKSKELDVQIGWLGRVFGSPVNVPGNICGLLIFFMVIIGGIITLWNFRVSPGEYWKIAQQLILPALAYLFGRGSKN